MSPTVEGSCIHKLRRVLPIAADHHPSEFVNVLFIHVTRIPLAHAVALTCIKVLVGEPAWPVRHLLTLRPLEFRKFLCFHLKVRNQLHQPRSDLVLLYRHAPQRGCGACRCLCEAMLFLHLSSKVPCRSRAIHCRRKLRRCGGSLRSSAARAALKVRRRSRSGDESHSSFGNGTTSESPRASIRRTASSSSFT
jgi:hypothetical protein